MSRDTVSRKSSGSSSLVEFLFTLALVALDSGHGLQKEIEASPACLGIPLMSHEAVLLRQLEKPPPPPASAHIGKLFCRIKRTNLNLELVYARDSNSQRVPFGAYHPWFGCVY